MEALNNQDVAVIALAVAAAVLFLTLHIIAYWFDTKHYRIDVWAVHWHERIMDETDERHERD